MQWDKRSRNFQLISKKCPESKDDMELKNIYPTALHKYGMQGDKSSRIFQLIFGKIWHAVGQKKQNFELISKKYGMQWDKRSRNFQLISKKCPESKDDKELKKI